MERNRASVHRPAVILLLIVFHSSLAAQSPDWAAVHTVTMRGIDRLYNLDINESIATFDSVRRMAPGDPRGYFFGSMAHFWIYTLTRSEKEFTLFMDKSEEVIAVCENILDAHEDDAVTRFYLGGIHGYRGLAHQFNNSIFKAVAEGKRGYSYLREAVEQKPDLYDAQMGFGLFNYFAGKVPRGLGWLVSLLGFSGDVEGGLRLMKAAAEKGVYTRTEASFWLAQFLFAEGRREEAITCLDSLTRKHPENSLFLLTLSNWYSRTSNPDAALATAQKAVAINRRKKIPYGEEFAYSTLGAVYFSRNDFTQARENFERFIETVQNRDFISNWIYYRLGVAQEITGDREKGKATYRLLKNTSDKDRANDRFYYRVAQERIATPMTGAEILIIKAENELGRKKLDTALVLFNDALKQSNGDPDIQARALYGVQGIMLDKELLAESIAAGLQLIALKPVHEIWLLPHGYLRLGRAYGRLGNTAEALRSFEKAGDYDDYDFQRGLEDRVEEEIAKLKKSG